MSAGNFFKRNEKVIMVVLLALIAPTFAFTGIIYTVMQQEDPVVTKLFGQPISSSDIGQAQRTMRDQRRIQGATVIGALAFQPQNRRFFQVSTDEAIDFIMWKMEAERLGIRASDAELRDRIREIGKSLIVHHQLMKAGTTLDLQTPEGNQQFQQRLNETRWTSAAYTEALTDKNFGDTTPKVFETQLRDFLSVGRVQSLAAGAAVISDKEVWEQFCRENELRTFEIVRIPTESYEATARETLSEEDKRKTFEARQLAYRIRDRVTLEVVKRSFAAVEVTEEELKGRWMEDRDALYVRRPANADAEAVYFTLDERREQVTADVKEDKLLAEMKSLAASAAEAKEAAEGEFKLASIVPPAEAHLYEVIETDPIERFKESEADPRVRNDPEFQQLLSQFSTLQEGQIGDEPVIVSDGIYVYRITSKLPSEAAKFENVGERLVDDAVKDKKADLAKEYAAEWRTKALDDEAVTMTSFATDEGHKLIATPAIGRSESAKVKDGDAAIIGASLIVSRGFQLAEPGEISEPFASYDNREVYLVRYVSRQDPTSEKFAAQQERIERQLTSAKQQEIVEAYAESVRTRADRRDTVFDEAPAAP